MSDPLEPMHYALPDEDLEAALIGEMGPESPLARSNPVAGFFVEARDLSRHQSAVPSRQLSILFAAQGAAAADAPDQVEAAVGPDYLSPGLVDVPAPTRNGHHYDRPAHHNDRPDDRYEVAAAATIGLPIDSFEEEPYGFEPSVPPTYHYQPVYRTSILETLRGLLAPSATKLLMVFTGVVLIAAVGHAVGAITLPLPGPVGSNDETVAGIVDGAAGGIASTSQVTGVDSPGLVPSTPGLSTPVVTPPPATRAPQTTAAVTTETSTEDSSTTTELTTTTDATTVTSDTTATTTSTVPPETSIVDTTLATTTTVLVTTVTEPPVTLTLPGGFVVNPGVLYNVPGDLPAGRYTARGVGLGGCSVTTTNDQGDTFTSTYGQGSTVTLNLLSGGTVITTAGCPQIFR